MHPVNPETQQRGAQKHFGSSSKRKPVGVLSWTRLLAVLGDKSVFDFSPEPVVGLGWVRHPGVHSVFESQPFIKPIQSMWKPDRAHSLCVSPDLNLDARRTVGMWREKPGRLPKQEVCACLANVLVFLCKVCMLLLLFLMWYSAHKSAYVCINVQTLRVYLQVVQN